MKRQLMFFCIFFVFLKASFANNEVYEPAITVWINEAVVGTYTYNYKNFLQRQKDIARFFTVKGWVSYSKALRESKIVDDVKKNEYQVSAVPILPPEVHEISQGQWQAVLPLLVSYKNPQYQQKQQLLVTVKFSKVASGQGIRGMAIDSLVAKETKPVCKCQ